MENQPLNLIPEEQELADALLLITSKYGKFDDDNTGVWAGYTSAEDNLENAAIGVKCGSCVFFNAPTGCSIIESDVEEGGLCRFAVLPDGAVDPSKGSDDVLTAAGDPCWDGYKQIGMKKGKGGKMVPNCVPVDASITADADGYGGECPPATQDIQLNLKNRQNAIDNVGYGPLNPAEPNEEFWQEKADRWNTDAQEAKSAVCGNCIFFVRTPKMLDCIEGGIGLGNQGAEGSIEAGELGYCNSLDFKCASERTCNAWAAGGPVTDDSNEDTATLVAAAKKRTKAQTPAPKKDRVKGSSKNKSGSASSGKGIKFSASVIKSLENKVAEHNEKAPNGRKVTLAKLKAVYRRGAGAFSVSHRPGMVRNQWAMGRVNAFLHLVKTGKPKSKKYTTDNDLLPKMHPRSSEASTMSPLLASLAAGLNTSYDSEDDSEDLLEPWLA